MLRGLAGLAGLALVAALAGPAAAQGFPPATDRGYTLDLYQGAVLGSVRIVGMGGAAVATAEGSAGTLVNPAAPAVRPATSRDTWDWDWHLDWLTPSLASDYDDNGQPDDSTTRPVFTIGGALQYRHWGLALGLTSFERSVTAGLGAAAVPLVFGSEVGHLALARGFAGDELTIGLGIRTGQAYVQRAKADLFRISGAALEAGALWRPPAQDLRLGASAGLPVTSDKVDASTCDPLNCDGYVLPDRAAVPWTTSIGFAYRVGPTPWNRPVAGHFRDERYLLLASDLALTGSVPDGHGVEAFSRGELQPSGRRVAVSLRAGAEYEWVPGRFRVRGGSYWEPSRYLDPAGHRVPGRLHLTLGFDLRVWSFGFRGDPYRIRLSFTADGAERYANTGASLGLWH